MVLFKNKKNNTKKWGLFFSNIYRQTKSLIGALDANTGSSNTTSVNSNKNNLDIFGTKKVPLEVSTTSPQELLANTDFMQRLKATGELIVPKKVSLDSKNLTTLALHVLTKSANKELLTLDETYILKNLSPTWRLELKFAKDLSLNFNQFNFKEETLLNFIFDLRCIFTPQNLNSSVASSQEKSEPLNVERSFNICFYVQKNDSKLSFEKVMEEFQTVVWNSHLRNLFNTGVQLECIKIKQVFPAVAGIDIRSWPVASSGSQDHRQYKTASNLFLFNLISPDQPASKNRYTINVPFVAVPPDFYHFTSPSLKAITTDICNLLQEPILLDQGRICLCLAFGYTTGGTSYQFDLVSSVRSIGFVNNSFFKKYYQNPLNISNNSVKQSLTDLQNQSEPTVNFGVEPLIVSSQTQDQAGSQSAETDFSD